MIKEYIKDFFQTLFSVITSRVFILGIVFVALFSLVVVRLFNLQIINGEDYLENYVYMTKKTLSTPSTRGNIYARDGEILAYNELAYAVVIEDSSNLSSSKSGSIRLNEIIHDTIKIIERNNDSLISDFSITLNENGELEFTTVSEIAKLQFLRDAYGVTSIAALDENGKNLSGSTAEELFNYMCTKRYNIYTELNYDTVTENMTPEKIASTKFYTVEEALKILTVRYTMSANYYQKYVQTTIASGVSAKTVAAILENKEELQCVTVEEETIRIYNDSEYFAHIIGYTGKIWDNTELETLKESNSSYELTDVVGKSGIESKYELELQGTKGTKTVIVDSLGRILDVESETSPTAGNDIYLTIDYDYQKECYDMLEMYLAGILESKIVNRDVVIEKNTKASDRYIPVKDVYYALFNNNIISINAMADADASEAEIRVYTEFTEKREEVLETLREQLLSAKPTIYSKLSEEYQVYMSYVYTMLTGNNVIVTGKIDTSDATYRAWRFEDSISLAEFLKYAITKNWIDTSKLGVEDKYLDTEQVYTALVDYINERLYRDNDFGKKLFKQLIKKYTITAGDICLILFEQGILEYDEVWYEKLINCKTATACTFIKEKIHNLEITPAQLALEPCSGSVVITDANSGEVIVMVTYPSYDNNMLSGSIDANYYSMLINDASSPLYNRATMTKVAPGSTYKMVSAITSLEENIITPTRKIKDLGIFETLQPAVKCWVYPSAHGSINVSQAIEKSCNFFFYEMGYQLSLDSKGVYSETLGTAKLEKYATLLGLNMLSGVELPESSPQCANQYPVLAAIGQSNNSFTNVQLARYTTTLANGGTNYKLTLLKKITDSNSKTLFTNTAVAENVTEFAESTWEAVRKGMRSVVTTGTVASTFKNFSIQLAGKTGTAQENALKPNHAVFIGYAPYDEPEIAVSVLIPNGYTSSYAAEIAKEALSIYYELNVTSEDEAIIPENGEYVD